MQAATDERRTGQLVDFAFDLLFLDGERLSERPLLRDTVAARPSWLPRGRLRSPVVASGRQ
jgi:hypothetical protein